MKKIFLSILVLIIISISFFTLHSGFRRHLLSYIFVTYDYYQLKTLTKDVQVRNFQNASKKINRYIAFAKKLSSENSFMINGIYDALELVTNRAVLQDDYNHLEKTFIEFLKMEPNSYMGNVWLGRAYSDNKPDESLKLFEKAISISPAQENAYREILRLSQIKNIKHVAKKYCEFYSISQLGGFLPDDFSSLFSSNNLRRFALSIVSAEKNLFYTNYGIVLNKLQDYEFVLEKKTNVNGLNLFFSLLPGINLKIKEIEFFSDDKNFLIPFDKLFVTSKNGYFDSNNNSYVSIIFPKLSDEVVTIDFNNNLNFKNIDKVKIKMNFSKLNLSSNLFCGY